MYVKRRNKCCKLKHGVKVMKKKPFLGAFLYVVINPFWLSFFLPAEKTIIIIIIMKNVNVGKIFMIYYKN